MSVHDFAMAFHLSKNAEKRMQEQHDRQHEFPKAASVEPANIAKRARRAAGINGSKASKKFRKANRGIGVSE